MQRNLKAGEWAQAWTAEALASLIPSGGTRTFWVSFGTPHGRREGFARRIMRLSADGSRIEALDSDGNVEIAYGLKRHVRVAVRRPRCIGCDADNLDEMLCPNARPRDTCVDCCCCHADEG